MAERMHLPTAMWRVQLDLMGGWRRTLAAFSGYLLLLGLGTFGLYAVMRPQGFAGAAGYALNFLALIQGGILVMGGTNAAYKAMLRDFDTKMLESHRITPMGNVAVVLGYLFGANIQTVCLVFVGMLFGAGVSFFAALPVLDWLAGHVLAGCGAVMLWSIVVFVGLRPAKPISPSPLIVVTALLTMLILLLPGAGVFTGTYAMYIAGSLVTGNMTFDGPSVLLVAGLSVLLTCFWVYAAAAKYRRPDLPALNALRGMVLLVLWLVLGTLGITAYKYVVGATMRSLELDELTRPQWIGTIVTGMLMALVPVAGAVHCRLLVGRGAAPRNRWDTVSDLGAALVAALLVPAITAGLGWLTWRGLSVSPAISIGFLSPQASAWLYTTAAVLLAVMTMRGLMTFCLAKLSKPGLPLVVFVILFWAGPVLGDIALATVSDRFNDMGDLSALVGLSPIGTVMVAWSGDAGRLLPGLAGQALIATLMMVFGARVSRTRFLAGHCTRCGYNLTGNTSGACSECGTPV